MAAASSAEGSGLSPAVYRFAKGVPSSTCRAVPLISTILFIILSLLLLMAAPSCRLILIQHGVRESQMGGQFHVLFTAQTSAVGCAWLPACPDVNAQTAARS